jgi:hypothetical protein
MAGETDRRIHFRKRKEMNKTTRNVLVLTLLVSSWARAVDLSNVPQIHETKEQRDARMQWFRDAKFGMFIHWGPCSVGQKEIGWGLCFRKLRRPTARRRRR